LHKRLKLSQTKQVNSKVYTLLCMAKIFLMLFSKTIPKLSFFL